MASASASVSCSSYTARYATLTTIGSLCGLPVNRSIMPSNASRTRRAPTATLRLSSARAFQPRPAATPVLIARAPCRTPSATNVRGSPWPYGEGLQSSVVCSILYFYRQKGSSRENQGSRDASSVAPAKETYARRGGRSPPHKPKLLLSSGTRSQAR
jgi:hypothetical protein